MDVTSSITDGWDLSGLTSKEQFLILKFCPCVFKPVNTLVYVCVWMCVCALLFLLFYKCFVPLKLWIMGIHQVRIQQRGSWAGKLAFLHIPNLQLTTGSMQTFVLTKRRTFFSSPHSVHLQKCGTQRNVINQYKTCMWVTYLWSFICALILHVMA